MDELDENDMADMADINDPRKIILKKKTGKRVGTVVAERLKK